MVIETLAVWLPISDAPTDGRDFIAWSAEGGLMVCCWRNNPYGNGHSGWGMSAGCTTEWADPLPTHYLQVKEPTE